jgi:hypothetical protein
MKTFTDNMDRKWNVEIVYQTIRRVRDALKINLAEPDEGDPPLASRLQSDLCLFCDVLYVICKPQADALNVTDEEFGRALGGKAILGARAALFEEYADFFLQLGQVPTAKAIRKTVAMIATVMAGLEAKVDAIDVDAEAAKVLNELSGSTPAS